MKLRNLGDSGSQWGHCNYYCPICKVSGFHNSHIKGCLGEKIRISATARFPRKNASKKIWDDFYKKFVLQEDLKEFLNKPKKISNATKTWKIQRRLKSFKIKNN